MSVSFNIMKAAMIVAAAGLPVFAQSDAAPDYDGSGTIDAADLLTLQQHLLSGNLAGDLNSDGELDFFDMLEFLSLASDPRATDHDDPVIDWSEMPADGELRFVDSERVAVVELDSGLTLHFVELFPGAVGVLEEAPEGAIMLDAIPGLSTAPPAEVFYALSMPGSAMPEALEQAELPPGRVAGDWEARPQGWARAFLAGGGADGGACDDESFKAYIRSFGYDDRGTPTFRLNQAPRSSKFFERINDWVLDYDDKGRELWYDFYRYTVGGRPYSYWPAIDRYITRVDVCKIANWELQNPGHLAHPPIKYWHNHLGPLVKFEYKLPGETKWRLAHQKDFDSPGKLAWHFYDRYNVDWRTGIYYAGGDDEFDIGHAVEDL